LKFPNKLPARKSNDGMATVIFIALLAIMMILVMAESRALIHLRLEEKLLEKQQTERLNLTATNTAAMLPAKAR
jgi:hypothetical protein